MFTPSFSTSMPSLTRPPTMAGALIMKLNLAAVSRSSRAATPPKMVLPLRLTPGSMPTACRQPMASASPTPTRCFSTPRSAFRRESHWVSTSRRAVMRKHTPRRLLCVST